MLDLGSEGPGSIPIRGNIFSKVYNPNLHNIARSDSLGLEMKNPNVSLSPLFEHVVLFCFLV